MKGLDKYLTEEPTDPFEPWCEDVVGNKLSNEFYENNEGWICEYPGQCDKWLNKLFRKDMEPEQAARIIERAFKLYIK